MTNDQLNQECQALLSLIVDENELTCGKASEEDIRRYSETVAMKKAHDYGRPVVVTFDQYSNPTFCFRRVA